VNLGVACGRFARTIGIIVIFSVVGPLSVMALGLLIIVGPGATVHDTLLALLGQGTLYTTASAARWLPAVVIALASFPPLLLAGTIFALIAVYVGSNGLRTAWLAGVIAIGGAILLGSLAGPKWSAVTLLNARAVAQAPASFAELAALMISSMTVCWWLAKPLSRAILPA
jgi:hypothetical protein